MKKYLVSGWDSSYGRFGGIRCFVTKAKNEDSARQQAREKYGSHFGYWPGQLSSEPYGIYVCELEEVNSPPELPGHWR